MTNSQATGSKTNSSAGWTLPVLAYFGSPTQERPHMSEQAARANLMLLEATESWLAASRQMIDLWRTSIREFQDGMLSSYRHQIVSTFTGDLEEEIAAKPEKAEKRQPLTKTAVAKAASAEAA